MPDHNTAENVRDWLESSEEDRRTGRGLRVLITSTGGGTLLGAVSLHAIDYENRLADIGTGSPPGHGAAASRCERCA